MASPARRSPVTRSSMALSRRSGKRDSSEAARQGPLRNVNILPALLDAPGRKGWRQKADLLLARSARRGAVPRSDASPRFCVLALFCLPLLPCCLALCDGLHRECPGRQRMAAGRGLSLARPVGGAHHRRGRQALECRLARHGRHSAGMLACFRGDSAGISVLWVRSSTALTGSSADASRAGGSERPGGWVHLKYYLLTAVLISAFFGVLLSGYVAAIPVLTRGLLFTGGTTCNWD